MEVRQQQIGLTEGETRSNEQVTPSLSGDDLPAPARELERADDGRADCDHPSSRPVSLVHGSRRAFGNPVELAVDPARESISPQRLKRPQPHVQGQGRPADPLRFEPLQQLAGEVQPRRGSGGGAAVPCEDGLVPLPVLRLRPVRTFDVRRKRNLAEPLHCAGDPLPRLEREKRSSFHRRLDHRRLQPLPDVDPLAGVRHPRGAEKRSPGLHTAIPGGAGPGEQQHLDSPATFLPASEPRREDASVVQNNEVPWGE